MTTKTGKIVINFDEWTLSDAGFRSAPDTARFVANLASWFTGGKPGKFHAYSSNFGLVQGALRKAMTDAGHTWGVGTHLPFTLEELRQRDAIFVGGNAANNQVLIDYVRAGGCVYLMAGTGWGGAVGEALRWKPFLNAFGFRYEPSYRVVGGRIDCGAEHPLFEGVDHLLSCNGNPVTDIDPEAPENAILAHSPDGTIGQIGVYDLALAEPHIAITDLLFDGKVKRTESDEYIEVSNQGNFDVDVSGWKICADDRGQDFVFPAGSVIAAQDSVRVYTNEVVERFGGYSYGSKRAIWNNKGDVGRLFDAEGEEVSSFAYGDKQSRDVVDVLNEQGVPGLTVVAPAREAQAKQGGSVDFLTALERAIISLVEDPSEGGDYTAATCVVECWDDAPSDATPAQIQAILRRYLNENRLTLVDADSVRLDDDGGEYPLEGYWIFELDAPLGDYTYVYVDRAGSKPTKQRIS